MLAPSPSPVDLGTRLLGGWRVPLSGSEWWLLDGGGDASGAAPPRLGEGPGWRPASVPGTVVAALHAQGVLPDPYVGLNNRDLEWIEERAWWMGRTFGPADIPDGERLVLEFHGVDYLCEVWLNGRLVGAHEGMFGGPQLDVTDVVDRAGENVLLVHLLPVERAAACEGDVHRQRVHSFSSAMLRDGAIRRLYKACFAFGWAYARIPTVGLWQGVDLVGVSARHIAGLLATTEEIAPGGKRARVRVQVDVAGVPGQGLRVEARLRHEGKLLASASAPADGAADLPLDVPGPPLWFPNGLGAQPLCDLDVQLLDAGGRVLDTATRRVGIRRIEMRANPGGAELHDWTLVANGTPFFARGFNWVPRDAMLRLPREAYVHHLHAMKEAGASLVRVWGWGLVETDEFYDLCDELGLLVWQEFPIAHGDHDDENLETLRQQATCIVHRLRNRASLALWSGGNELHLLEPSRSAAVLDLLEELVPRLDPSRPHRRTSPHGGDHHFGGVAQDESVYGGEESYLARPDDPAARDTYSVPVLDWIRCGLGPGRLAYNRLAFVSEVPTPTMMGEESLARVVDPAELDRPLPAGCITATHPQLRHHSDLQFDWLPAMLARASQFGNVEGRTPRELVPLLQYQQAVAYQSIAECFRGNWPRTSGLLYWAFNGPSPLSTWELMDWFGVAMPSLSLVKRAFAPELVVARFPRLFFAPGERVAARHVLLQDPGLAAGRARVVRGRLLDGSLEVVHEVGGPVAFGEALAADASCPPLDAPVPADASLACMLYVLDLLDGGGKVLSRRHYPLRVDERMADAATRRRTREPMASWRVPDGPGKLRESVQACPTMLRLEVLEHGGTRARLRVANKGARPAFMVELRAEPNDACLFGDNHLLLMPGEAQEVSCWSPRGASLGGFTARAWNAPPTGAA